jgi:hypothetical protein
LISAKFGACCGERAPYSASDNASADVNLTGLDKPVLPGIIVNILYVSPRVARSTR